MIDRSWLIDEEIFENNRKILEKKFNESKAYCQFCRKEIDTTSDYCINSSTNLKEEDKAYQNLKIYVEKIYEEQQNKK